MQQGDDDTSAGSADGVADGDRAAVDVDLAHVEAELTGNSDGLGRGLSVIATGHGIAVPVGEKTLGRMFNVLGEPIDGEQPVDDSVPRWEIHRPAPTFAEYAAALESVGCEVKRKTLHEADDFAVTEAFVQAVNQSIDLVFLCQPNNPTGQITPPELVQRLVHRCADCGAVLVVDECFLDFLQQRDALTAKPLLQTAPNLVILKAFTKLYAMAGVRLGYALCSNTALLAKMQAAGQPWGVSSLAQAAGAAALRETAYADAVRALIADQRPRLAAGLRALGLQVIEGSANYLLFRAPETLGAALQQRGVCLRSCGNYPGLSAGWYRTAVRTAPENEQLLQTMREVLK